MSSAAYLGMEASPDGVTEGGSGLGLVFDQESLMNVGKGLEVFPAEFENYMAQLSSCESARQKLEKKKKGKMKDCGVV